MFWKRKGPPPPTLKVMFQQNPKALSAHKGGSIACFGREKAPHPPHLKVIFQQNPKAYQNGWFQSGRVFDTLRLGMLVPVYFFFSEF